MIASEESLLSALDPEQRAVAEAVRAEVCVRAGAGTGKTRAITYRIAYAVRSGVVQPHNVLALTFTARAAGEMRSRLRDLGVQGVQARTFHSAALSQLRYFWPYAIGGHVPEVRESKAAIISAAAAQLDIPNDVPTVKDLASEIEWAKVSLIPPQDYPLKARQAGRTGVAGCSPEEIAECLKVYEDLKAERAVIDFEDVILILIGIMLDRPDITRTIREQYTYFVVDEYQDVSPMQHRLLQLWLGDRRDICVVGDAAQTIYSFTGAQSSYLENFAHTHKRAQEITLDRNYRSTPEIIELANEIVRDGAGVRAVHLRAMNPSGSSVTYSDYAHGSQEAERIVARIKHMQSRGQRLSDIAILYRTGAQSREFEQALGEAGISYQLQGQESFFKRQEVREAMVALRAQARDGAGGYAPDGVQLPDSVEEVLRNMGWRPEGPSMKGASRQRWESLDSLRVLAQDMWTARKASLKEFVTELEERAELHNTPAINAVTLASLHSAKGLEWEVVFLAGMAEGLMPISYADSPQEIEEEKRLLYVGITRAKKELYISYARSYGNRASNTVSRFLEPLWPRSESRSTQARRRASKESAEFERENPSAYARFEKLRQWRAAVALELAKPAYLIFHDSALRAIALAEPQNLAELAQIRGIGTTKLSLYGPEILRVLGED